MYLSYVFTRLKDFEWSYLFIALFLSMSGLLAIYSIEFQQEGASFTYLSHQILWIIIGIFLAFGAYLLPRKILHNGAYFGYAIGIVLLLIPVLTNSGQAVNRWIYIGKIGFQPSEFMKIVLLISLARYFSDHKRRLKTLKELMTPSLMAIIPTVLVLIQPDLGTALVYFAMLIVVIFWVGIRPLYFFLLIAPAISMLASFQTFTFFIWMGLLILILYLGKLPSVTGIINFAINISLGGIANVLWNFLKPYQQQRILSLFNSESDPLGVGYQVSQSLTAFGSGGAFGKGLGQGTQTHLKFLPEQHTDFIMTVIGEEFGFLGVSIVMALFYILIARLINQAYASKFRFDSIILAGVAAILVFHTFVNMAMIAGIMPVTGIPLPFISYGGSFILTCMFLIGLAANLANTHRVSN